MEDKTAATQLKDLIVEHFNLGELQELCFEIGFDYEELPNTKGEKSINVIVLLKTLHQKDLLSQFVNLCKEKRPFIEWPNAPTELYFEEDLQTEAQLQEALDEYKIYIQGKWGRDSLLDGPLDDFYIWLEGQGPEEKNLKEASSLPETSKDSLPESSSEDSEASKQNQDKKEPQYVSYLPPPLPPPLVLQEALEKHKRLIVLGTAGTGKSTFLRRLVYQKTTNNGSTVPIWVKLSDYAEVIGAYAEAIKKGNPPPRPEPSLEQWAIKEAHKDPTIQAILHKAVEDNQVLWLLDGFDETGNQMNKVADAIAQIPSKNQLVLTTRPDTRLKEHRHKFNATQYKMRNLSQHDAEQFLQKWFDNPDKTAEVLKWLTDNNHPQRRELITKPLHLVLLATIRKETSENKFPETRVQLYGKFIDIFLNKRIEERRDGNRVFPLGTLKRDEARAAAIEGFHCLGWVLFHQERELSNNGITIDKQVIDCLEQAGYSNEDAEAILSFWQEAGVQKSFHQTFWSYAAACKLYDDWQTNAENAWQFLSSATRELPYASRLHHPAWQEPILMLAALMNEKQLNNLIDRLLRKPSKEERYLRQNLRLAAVILGEIETEKINEEYEQRVIRKLGELTRNYPKAHQAIRDVGFWSAVGVLVFELLLLSQWRLLMQFEWFLILQFGIITILVVRQLGELIGYLAQLTARGVTKRGLWGGLLRFLSPTKTIQYLSKHVENIGMRVLRALGLDIPNPQAFIEALSSVGVLAIRELEYTFNYWALREKPRIRPPWQRYGYFDWELNTTPPYEVVKGLEKIGGKKVVPFLSRIMNDWTGRISLAATDALGRIRDEAAIEALIHAVENSPEEDVRRAATIALGKRGDEKAIPSLINSLKNPTFDFDRKPAAQALIQIGKDSLPALCKELRALQDENIVGDENIHHKIRQQIAEIMGEIGDPQVIPILLKWLENRKGDPSSLSNKL